jgi:hypothetical protein
MEVRFRCSGERRFTTAGSDELRRVAGNVEVNSPRASLSSIYADTLLPIMEANDYQPFTAGGRASQLSRRRIDMATNIVRGPSGATIAERTMCWPREENPQTMGMWNRQTYVKQPRTQQTAADRLTVWLSK